MSRDRKHYIYQHLILSVLIHYSNGIKVYYIQLQTILQIIFVINCILQEVLYLYNNKKKMGIICIRFLVLLFRVNHILEFKCPVYIPY